MTDVPEPGARAMNRPQQYILVIDWGDATQLPGTVGPFPSRDEANQWARLNVLDPHTGLRSWEIHPLAYPYLTGEVDG